MSFIIQKYLIAKVRDGSSSYEKDKAISEMKSDEIFVHYKDDVTSYYYAVPSIFKDEIGSSLLEFFYKDNYDYTDEMLQSFKESYPDFF